jgi:hypothetical protein
MGRNHRKQSQTPAAQAAPVEATPQPPISEPTDTRREVLLERRCPSCYHGEDNGIGNAYANKNGTRYYKCDKCGFTWTALVKMEVIKIEHRRVDLTER